MFVHNGLTFTYKVEVSTDPGDDPVCRYFNYDGAARLDFNHWRGNESVLSLGLYEHSERTARVYKTQEPVRIDHFRR